MYFFNFFFVIFKNLIVYFKVYVIVIFIYYVLNKQQDLKGVIYCVVCLRYRKKVILFVIQMIRVCLKIFEIDYEVENYVMDKQRQKFEVLGK